VTRRLVSAFLVFVLVASVFAFASTGTVAAQDDGGEAIACGTIFEFLVWGDCSDDAQIATDGATSEEVQSSIYSSAGTVNQGSESVQQSVDALSDRGQNAVWSEAKVEIVEGLENGTAESKVKDDARQIVDKRLTELERAVLDRAQTITNEMQTLNNTVAGTDNLTLEDVLYWDDNGNVGKGTISHQIEFGNNTTWTYTLRNGESYNYSGVTYTLYGDSWLGSGEGNQDWFVSSYDEGSGGSGVVVGVSSSDSQLSGQPMMDGGKYAQLLRDIQTAESDLTNNVEQYASDIYANYTAGEVNASQFLSAADVAQNYNLNSQNGTAYSTASAALLGYETNASTSIVIEYTSTGATLSGNLFSTDGAPTTYNVSTGNNTTTSKQAWVKGHTYDVSEYSGSIYMAVDDDWQNITSDFEIIEMEQATTGVPLNYTTDRTYATVRTDASNLSRALADLNAAMDNRTREGSGGGMFGGSSSSMLILIVGLLGGGYLVMRASGGNGGNGGGDTYKLS
jgi:hypothetical protein